MLIINPLVCSLHCLALSLHFVTNGCETSLLAKMTFMVITAHACAIDKVIGFVVIVIMDTKVA